MTKKEADFIGSMNMCDEISNEAYKKIMCNCEDEESQTRWIPVSERLPEERIAVLIWCPERKNIYCAYREENQWWIFGAYFQKVPLEVIAWMPLPSSYQGE